MKFAVAILLLAITMASVANPATVLRFSATQPGLLLPTGWKSFAMSRRHAMAGVSVVSDDGIDVLHIDADHAAGAIAHKLDLPASTILSWRWKVDHSVAKANLMRKRGDDFAARVYVFFDLPRSALSFGQRLKLRLADALFGHSLPRAALCYVWDNNHHVGTIANNAFYSGVRMIVLQSGDRDAGAWQIQHRNLADDFRLAFHRPAPRVTGIALAADTDNTGSRANAWFGDVSFTANPTAPVVD